MSMSYQKRVLWSAILMLTILAVIAAALWFPKVERKVKVEDMMFVLDITDSMYVKDANLNGEKVSRLAWAKAYVRQTLQKMPCGSRAGLGIFTESRSLILINPIDVCRNYTDLTHMLQMIDGKMAWVKSSEVSKAVFSAIDQVHNISPQPNVIFITDGHEAPPLNDKLYPKFRGTPGEVKGVLIGVGGKDLMPIPKHDRNGKFIGYWQPDEVMQHDVYTTDSSTLTGVYVTKAKTEHLSSQKKAHLEKLATMVGFRFLSSPSNPQQLINVVDKESKGHAREQMVKTDLSPWFVAIALALLLLLYLPYTLIFRSR